MHAKHHVPLVVVTSIIAFLLIEILGSWSWPAWLAWVLATLLLVGAVNAAIWLYRRG